jgi:CelD/BcsL family acetyltransferase involved in cellulose biosynthesis
MASNRRLVRCSLIDPDSPAEGQSYGGPRAHRPGDCVPSTAGMSERSRFRGELIEDPDVPATLKDRWDELAVARGRPFCGPAWTLAWWRNARPRGALLRIVAVWDGDELVGILPFFSDPIRGGLSRYRLLASKTSAHVEPLARAGLEREVATEAARVLSSPGLRPDVVSFPGISAASPWPSLLQASWPDHAAWLHRGPGMPAPRLTLAGRSYQEWFSGLSRHRRAEFRRRRRRLDEQGAVARLIDTSDGVVAGLKEFAALHYERWSRRGGSGALDPGIEAMLAEVALELVPSLRFRLWSIEVDGRSISSSVFVAAGGEVSYWLGGFDAGWAQYGPAIETVRAALEHAWSVGDRVVDFGPGGQHYKYTFADGQSIVEPVDLVPRTSHHARARIQLAPEHVWTRMRAVRYEAFRNLSPGSQQRLKAVRARIRRQP